MFRTKPLLLWILFVPSIRATTIQVPGDWPTIGQALQSAVSGDTVRVSDGLWIESLDFAGRNVVLRGSGSGQCILQGNGQRLVRFVSGEGPQAELTGFRLRQGTAPDGVWNAGGAVLVRHSSPRIHGNHFEDCGARLGGALALHHSSSVVEHNSFGGNQAFMGGAVHVLGGAPVLQSNLFEGNQGGLRGYGGALALENSAALVEGNLLVGNGAFLGGALSVRLSPQAWIRGNTLADNTSRLGGGIYVAAGNPGLQANLVSGSTQGGAVAVGLQAVPALDCNLHHGNTGGNGFPGQDLGGNRILDPLFCDPAGGDYRLQPLSPCFTADCGVIGYTDEHCDGTAVAPTPAQPGSFTLTAAPNPFNSSTLLSITAPVGRPWRLDLFSITGARVACLGRSATGGATSLLLDAHHPGDRTSPLAAGVYLLRLDHPGGELCSKVIFLP